MMELLIHPQLGQEHIILQWIELSVKESFTKHQVNLLNHIIKQKDQIEFKRQMVGKNANVKLMETGFQLSICLIKVIKFYNIRLGKPVF